MTPRLLGTLGVAGAALAVLLIGAQHLVSPDVDPVRSTISAYGLGGFTPLFDGGVLALAAGSACVLAGGIRSGLIAARSVAAAGFATWIVALVLVVAFEKVDWSVGATPSGLVHLYAGLVAFTVLPVAVLALAVPGVRRGATAARVSAGHAAADAGPEAVAGAVPARRAAGRGWAVAAVLAAVASVLWLSPFVIGVFSAPYTGVPWWRFVPIGLVQRGLALTEVVAVVVIALWVRAENARSA
ncbi:DUF998 domain-containing protein [Pseudonocardia nematodicida]|uniref:DUF998 domain-containing protein n=1 Tax=Pseudonocardia nematodicida TaxID=1206997 RepID=A0ABV1K7G6_9PSEU